MTSALCRCLVCSGGISCLIDGWKVGLQSDIMWIEMDEMKFGDCHALCGHVFTRCNPLVGQDGDLNITRAL